MRRFFVQFLVWSRGFGKSVEAFFSYKGRVSLLINIEITIKMIRTHHIVYTLISDNKNSENK